MKVLGVIPARYGSTRFPGKPLVSLNGKPMLQWVIEAAKECAKLNDLIVATDDQRIFDFVKTLNVKVEMTDQDLPTGTDRVFAVSAKQAADVVINIQGDEPLLDPKTLDALVAAFENDAELQMATLAHPISVDELASPNAVKVVTDKNGMALYFSRFAIPYSRLSAADLGNEGCLKHIGMYAFRKNFLAEFCATRPTILEKAESLEQLRALYLGARIKILKVSQATPGVDTPEDLKKVEGMMKLKNGGKK